jgi:hypothetical protein
MGLDLRQPVIMIHDDNSDGGHLLSSARSAIVATLDVTHTAEEAGP